MKVNKFFLLFLLFSISLIVSACGTTAEVNKPTENSPSEGNSESVAPKEEMADLPEIEMTVGHAEAGDTSNHIHAAAVAFKEYVEEKSSGKIKVNIVHGGALGDADHMMQQAMVGALEVAGSVADGSLVAVDPNMLVWSIPYLFENEEQAVSIYHGNFGKKLWESFTEKTDLKPLITMSAGFRMITNNKRPVKTPDDLKGLQIRTMNMPAHMEVFKNLGATATPISWTELYAALQTGVVDGQENGIPSIILGNLYEVQKHLSINGYVWTQDTFLISKIWLDKQPEQYQKIIMDGGAHAEQIGEQMSIQTSIDGINILKEKMEVYESTPEEIESFKQAVQGPVSKFIREQISDPELVDELIAETNK